MTPSRSQVREGAGEIENGDGDARPDGGSGGGGDEEKVDGDTDVEVGVSTDGRVMSEVGHWAKGGEPR